MKQHLSSFRLAFCALAVGCTLVTPPARAVEYGGFVGPATVDTRFLPVPLILADPQSVTNLPGTPATFKVNAVGMAPLAYQWRKAGLPLTEGGNVSGARSTALTLASVQWPNAGQYTAVVTNAFGSVTSRVASLTVLGEPPQFLTQPQSQAVLPGTKVLFSVTVTGTPPFSFQWRGNGTNLADDGRISGAHTNSLSITNVQGQDAGLYTAVVSNPWASVTSAPARLRVFIVERLTLSVSNQVPARFDFTNVDWVEITLTTPFPNALIFYTLDGSAPSAASDFYSGPLIVSNTVVLRALAYNPVDFSSVEMAPAAVNLWTAFRLVATATAGGMVSLEPAGGFYLSNTVVTLTAVPEAGWELLSWSGDASGTSTNLSLVMDRDKSVTAQFGLIPRFTLAVATVGGGTVSGNTQSDYLRGTTVNLRAEPAPDWEFLSWAGDASGTSSNLSLVMDRDKSVTAQSGRIPVFTLAVTEIGAGSVSGNTQSNYFRGTTVDLSTEPELGWCLLNWSGDASGTSRNLSVVMDRDKSVVARFAPLTLLAVAAGGGTITANPASNYVLDLTVELTAQPQSGWTFLNWMGDASGTNPSTTVTMDRPKEVQAVFGTACNTTVLGLGAVVRNFGTGLVPFGGVVRLTAIPQPGYYLGLWGGDASSVVNPLGFTVTKANPTVGAFFLPLGANQATLTVLEQGAGTVAREPAANAYTKGLTVRLLAQPFPGQAFLGWSGDASGSQNPLTATVATNRTITATFTYRLALAIHQWPGPTQPRGFRLLLAGAEGNTCLVQTSPDLAAWQPLTTLTISNTAVQFIDVAVTNHSPRFYRAISQP
jgi:hypothetical protein